MDPQEQNTDVGSRARMNTQASAFTAGMMILFGYFYFLIPESPSNLVENANVWFVYALRIGGLLMVAVAVLCSLGHSLGLLMDAIISTTVGVVLLATGVIMLFDGGITLECAAIGFAGVMLGTAGLRIGRDYLQFAAIRALDADRPDLEEIGDMMRQVSDNVTEGGRAEPTGPERGSRSSGGAVSSPAASSASPSSYDVDLVEMKERPKPERRYSVSRYDESGTPISLADLADSSLVGGLAGDSSAGDTSAGDTSAGDTSAGDTAAGESEAGKPAKGESGDATPPTGQISKDDASSSADGFLAGLADDDTEHQ
ncbi:MAG: hypothetical protein ACYTHJ_13535 [Planctomycetota bacterium]|jgi:hypothetical protein